MYQMFSHICDWIYESRLPHTIARHTFHHQIIAVHINKQFRQVLVLKVAQAAFAAVFSKIDTNSGFWQILLEPSSRLLMTFLTPFGRFSYNKFPFGIASVLEHFQHRMNHLLEGLPGIVCHVNDILIYGKDLQEHSERIMYIHT